MKTSFRIITIYTSFSRHINFPKYKFNFISNIQKTALKNHGVQNMLQKIGFINTGACDIQTRLCHFKIKQDNDEFFWQKTAAAQHYFILKIFKSYVVEA